MSTAEGAFISREFVLPRPEIKASDISDRLARGMRRAMGGVRKLGEEQKINWFSRIGTGVTGEKVMAEFGATLIQVEDAKKRTELLSNVLGKLFPNQSPERTAHLAELVSHSVDNLKQVREWGGVLREITTVAEAMKLPDDYAKNLKNSRILNTSTAPNPWDKMESVPPPPLPPLGSGGPKPPQRDFMGWLRDVLKPHLAGIRHRGQVIFWGAAVAIVGGVIIVGGSRILGSMAENASIPQIGGAATLRDRLAKAFAGYENRYDTESITYSKIIDGKPPADWSIEKQLDFLKNSDDATRVVSLAAFRTKLEEVGINTYADAETYLRRYYKGTDLTDILVLAKYALLSSPTGFPDSHGFDSYFNIPTPSPTPATSPVPTKTPAPTPRIISQEQRESADRLTRDLKSRQNATVRKTGSVTKGF